MAAALVDFHRSALRDYQSAMRWYERKGTHLVQPFKDAVKECVSRIAANPYLGAIYQTQFRWQRTKRYPYVLYYHVLAANHVLILAVAHGRRRPGYWLRRRA